MTFKLLQKRDLIIAFPLQTLIHTFRLQTRLQTFIYH